jgi:hypothetical protein
MAEFQGEDFHLDRGLFLACQKDRHHLCPQVKPGEGRIYECLLANKMVIVCPISGSSCPCLTNDLNLSIACDLPFHCSAFAMRLGTKLHI